MSDLPNYQILPGFSYDLILVFGACLFRYLLNYQLLKDISLISILCEHTTEETFFSRIE